jgi:nicotinate-nucleotide adenylyltransferase
MKRKIILFGGSFDPIHNGHLAIARYALEQIKADELIFVPAQQSPHKRLAPEASASDRLKMIGIAIADEKAMAVTDCELNRTPPSYTIDTVRFFRARYEPATEFYWLIGADMLRDLPKWFKINELLDECYLCLMLRPGFDKIQFQEFIHVFGADRIRKLEQNVISNPLVDISSTEIRRRILAGEDISQMVHPGVLLYIKEHLLYSKAF